MWETRKLSYLVVTTGVSGNWHSTEPHVPNRTPTPRLWLQNSQIGLRDDQSTGCLSCVPQIRGPPFSAPPCTPEGPAQLASLPSGFGWVGPMGRSEGRSERRERERDGGIHSPGSPAARSQGLAVSLPEGLAPSKGSPMQQPVCRSINCPLPALPSPVLSHCAHIRVNGHLIHTPQMTPLESTFRAWCGPNWHTP